MDNRERLSGLLLNGAVVGTAVPTGSHLLAFIDHGLKKPCILTRLCVGLNALKAALALFLTQQQLRAIFADTLQDVQGVLEVANVEHWKS